MNENGTGFVRKDMVRTAEPYRLGAAGNAVSAPSGPRAQLIRHEGTTALVEIHCSCGQKIQLNCECEQEKVDQ